MEVAISIQLNECSWSYDHLLDTDKPPKTCSLEKITL